MSKFSDLPRFLLNDYFNESLSNSTVENATITPGSYLYGPRTSIVADGGYWTKIWIKVDKINDETVPYPGLVEYKFRLNDDIKKDDNFIFIFGSLLTLPASANDVSTSTFSVDTATETFESGSEVYFRKGSYIYEWLVKNSTYYKNYFNTNKMWMYFGKIYKTSEYTNGYYIIFDGMKNFALNALPRHQRKTNIEEFFNIYFDVVHQKIYNMTKNIPSLFNAREIDANWIEYMAKNYNIDLDENMSGMALREWVENIVYLLKRKGTYSSLYIIWKTLLENTTDNLNIYNRWHTDLTGITDVPLGNFLDILHQMEYGIRPEGCAGSYWYEKSLTLAESIIFIQNNPETIWDIYHQMYSYNIIVQCYNSNSERVWPASIVAINSGLIRVTFGEDITGFALLERRGDFLSNQNSPISNWNINHILNQKNVISQYQTTNYETMMPDNINLKNENVIETDFSTPLKGYGLIKSDGVYKFNQSISSTIWTINHGLGEYVFLQAFDTNDDMLEPISIVLSNTDGGTASLTFNNSISGYILVKLISSNTTLPTYSASDMILSPHYKVEIDLSCEPIDDDASTPAILSEETIDMLINNWEKMRPVTRFSHYHELISPIVDFTGNNISLYGSGYNASLETKYVTSGNELLPKSDSDVMIYNQYVNKSEWTITHTLSAEDWIVQCYNDNDYRIWPKEIYSLGTRTVKLEFEDAVNGHAVFIEMTPPSGSSYLQSTASSAWDVTHTLGSKEVLVQWDDRANIKSMPSAATLESVNNIKTIWAEKVEGYTQISGYDNIYIQTTPSITWIMNHNIGTDSLVVQFFDGYDQMIEPDSIHLDNRNKATAIFSESVSGYAVMRGINNVITEADVMSSMVSGTWMIGQGTSGINYNPLINNGVESILTSGSNLSIDNDDDYYYVDFEVSNTMDNEEDWNIKEILLRDDEGNPKFYSYFSPIYKPDDVWFNVHFRIKRSQT